MDAREYMARKGLDGSRDEERPNTLEEKAWERARQAGGHQPRAGTPHDWEDWERYHDKLAEGADTIEQKIDHEAHRQAKEEAEGVSEAEPVVREYVPPKTHEKMASVRQVPPSMSSLGRQDSLTLRFSLMALALLLPPLAVGLSRGGAGRIAICLLLTLLGWLPGCLYAWWWLRRGA